AGEGQVDGQVGGRARVGLDVGVVDPEQGLRPLNGQGLDGVYVLLALVVAAARVALVVLVGQHRTGGLEDGDRCVVLRRDQPDLLELPARLPFDQAGDLRVGPGDVRDGRLVHSDLLGTRLQAAGRGPVASGAGRARQSGGNAGRGCG